MSTAQAYVDDHVYGPLTEDEWNLFPALKDHLKADIRIKVSVHWNDDTTTTENIDITQIPGKLITAYKCPFPGCNHGAARRQAIKCHFDTKHKTSVPDDMQWSDHPSCNWHAVKPRKSTSAADSESQPADNDAVDEQGGAIVPEVSKVKAKTKAKSQKAAAAAFTDKASPSDPAEKDEGENVEGNDDTAVLDDQNSGHAKEPAQQKKSKSKKKTTGKSKDSSAEHCYTGTEQQGSPRTQNGLPDEPPLGPHVPSPSPNLPIFATEQQYPTTPSPAYAKAVTCTPSHHINADMSRVFPRDAGMDTDDPEDQEARSAGHGEELVYMPDDNEMEAELGPLPSHLFDQNKEQLYQTLYGDNIPWREPFLRARAGGPDAREAMYELMAVLNSVRTGPSEPSGFDWNRDFGSHFGTTERFQELRALAAGHGIEAQAAREELNQRLMACAVFCAQLKAIGEAGPDISQHASTLLAANDENSHTQYHQLYEGLQNSDAMDLAFDGFPQQMDNYGFDQLSNPGGDVFDHTTESAGLGNMDVDDLDLGEPGTPLSLHSQNQLADKSEDTGDSNSMHVEG